jgi:hypothetical protein
MTGIYYSPSGNRERWATQPDGYMTEDEYMAAHPETIQPGPCHVWDGAAWVVNADLAAEAIRAERDRRIEAVRWRIERWDSESRQGLTPTDDIAALDGYVQALRDLTGQAGFPWQGDVSAAPWPSAAGVLE